MLSVQHQGFISKQRLYFKQRLFSKQTLFGFIPAAAGRTPGIFRQSTAEDTAILAAKW
jgi:hypothetical protein